MTHTNFKKIEGLPQQSKTGVTFIRSKGKIFTIDTNTQPNFQNHELHGKDIQLATEQDKN